MDRAIGSTETARTAREVVLVDPATGAAGVGQGGVYHQTQITLSTGQRGDTQVNSKGELLVAVDQMVAGDGQSATLCAVHDRAGASRPLACADYVFNGATYDRHRKPNGAARMASSSASTNATTAKASAGDVIKVMGRNTSPSVIYLKLFNKASTPSAGTDTPTISLALPPTANFDFDLSGHYFGVGISYALTTGVGDSDTGSIGAGDVVGLNITFA